MRATLEVIALDEHDAEHAEAGGADRLEIVGTMRDDGLSPPPDLVERIRRATALPIRVMLRLRAGFATDADELGRLRALAAAYRGLGAGLVLGFLDAAGEIDVASVRALGVDRAAPWTFHRAVDACADGDRAWAVLATLGCDQVLTAGSPHGMAHGLDSLIARATRTPASRAIILAGGGLEAAHVAPLAVAGVRAFHIGRAARPDGDWSAHVAPANVRAWRALLDDRIARSQRQ